MQEQVRLQKYMAEAGAGSRRKCEEWIRQGLVRVNGEVVTELGTKLDPQKDVVEFRGKVLRPTQELVTVMLNKPAGYVTTSRDQFGRPDVGGLVRIPGLRLYPVGRLDYQTTGLLLMTNDGDLAFHLTHPRHHIRPNRLVSAFWRAEKRAAGWRSFSLRGRTIRCAEWPVPLDIPYCV